MAEKTMIFLNTWGAYNDGCIGYGWMEIEEARDFMAKNPERDGGEWFIADLDNYTGATFQNLEYANVSDVLDTLEALEALKDWERDEIVALMEYLNTEDAQEALDDYDNYIFYSDLDEYHDSCDECLNIDDNDSILARYFDYDAFHRDCDFDIYEASNGIVIAA